VLGDKSVGVFNGELIADKHTKNIDAHQLNKNLLLNKGAVIYTKPELRIETDDIKCGHGASIGELDDKSMFYLLSRGISKPQAKLMLMQAFLMRPVSDEDFSCWREFLDRLLSKSIRSHFWCEDNI
jgi:Fe-S cluster assembly protein SufD